MISGRIDEVVEGARRRHVGGARRGQARGVGRVDVAAAGEEGGTDLVDLLDDHRLERHLVGAEVIGEVELGGRAGSHADRGAAQLLGALHAELLRHQEALAVVVVDAGEIEAERGVARQRPGRVADQHVDLARLHGGEALLGGERRVLHLVRVAEDRRGDGAADVDREAFPFALAVRHHVAGRPGAGAADQRAARLDGIEHRPGLAAPAEPARQRDAASPAISRRSSSFLPPGRGRDGLMATAHMQTAAPRGGGA